MLRKQNRQLCVIFTDSKNRNKDLSVKDIEFQYSEEWFKKIFGGGARWYSSFWIKFARDCLSHGDEAIFPKEINGYQLEISNANSSFLKSEAF